MKNKKLLLAILSILISSSISYSDEYVLERISLRDLDKKDFLFHKYDLNYLEYAKQILESTGILSKNRQGVIDEYSDFLKYCEDKYKNVNVDYNVNIFKNDLDTIIPKEHENISLISNKILSEEEVKKILENYVGPNSITENNKELSDLKENLDFFYESYEKVLEYNEENKKLLKEISEDTRNKYNDFIKNEDNYYYYYFEEFIRTLPENEGNNIKKIVENNRKIFECLVVFKSSGNYDYKEFFDVNNMPKKESIDKLYTHFIGHNLTFGGKNKNFGENTSIFGVGNIVEKSGSNVYGDRNKLISNTDTKLVGSDNTIYGEKNIVLGSKNNIGEETNISSGNIVIGNEVEIKGINNAIVLGNKSKAVENAISVGSENNKRKITFVKDGEISSTSSDAINGSQLYNFKQELNRSTGGKIATALSIAAIPQVNGNKKFSFGVGAGYSGSDISIAFGFSGQTDSKNVVYKLSGAVNTSNEIALSGGVNYSFSEMESKEYSGIKFIINEFNKDEVKLNDKLIRKLNGIIEFITDNNIKNIEIYSSDNEYNTIMRINEIKKYIKNKNVKIKVSMKILENISKTENIIINILR